MAWLTGLVGLDLYLGHRGRVKAKKRYKKQMRAIAGEPVQRHPHVATLANGVEGISKLSRRGKVILFSVIGAFILYGIIASATAGHGTPAPTHEQLVAAQTLLQSKITTAMHSHAGVSYASVVCPLNAPSQVGSHFTCTAADMFNGTGHYDLPVQVVTTGHGHWKFTGSLV